MLLNTAIASPRQLCQAIPGITIATVYTAPSATSNVTSPSATAYIKEIIICNVNAAAQTLTIQVGGQPIISNLSIAANDTKVLSGLNTMMPAGATITMQASAINCIIATVSGVEVQ